MYHFSIQGVPGRNDPEHLQKVLYETKKYQITTLCRAERIIVRNTYGIRYVYHWRNAYWPY
jgi:hypothetical protein